MNVDARYEDLTAKLRRRSIRAYMQAEDQLVVSRQSGAPSPDAGNSFWLSQKESDWYLCTWAPRCYRVPCDADLVTLIERFVDYGGSAQGAVPPEMVELFGLVELSLDEAERHFGWDDREEQSRA